jgi:hypothetical protein
MWTHMNIYLMIISSTIWRLAASTSNNSVPEHKILVEAERLNCANLKGFGAAPALHIPPWTAYPIHPVLIANLTSRS